MTDPRVMLLGSNERTDCLISAVTYSIRIAFLCISTPAMNKVKGSRPLEMRSPEVLFTIPSPDNLLCGEWGAVKNGLGLHCRTHQEMQRYPRYD